ncbi:hypothetical protein GALL_536310 [mine drainage metagenome]|uniref:Uncharacterized protein n=1 Tax=mine drainage metagenome TaxID=410659 RepID=A0A1J5P2D9_9ZZZZ
MGHAQQRLGDFAPQLLVLRVVVHGQAVTRTRQVHREGLAQTGTRAHFQRDDTIRQHQGFVDIVGDQQDRLLVLAPDTHDFVLQLGTCQRIQCRQGFVEQQHIRVGSQCPRHGDALAHTTRQLLRLFVNGGRKSHHGNVVAGALLPLGCGFAGKNPVYGQGHIFTHRQPGHQRVTLEHDAPVRTRFGNGFAPLEHFAAIGLF